MTKIRPCPIKNHPELVLEWDRLAEKRYLQISSGEDISYKHVVIPTVWQLLEGTNQSIILDIGSGTGDFTFQLAKISKKIIAVEPSKASITLAQKICQNYTNIQFLNTSLEETANLLHKKSITIAVAVMSLMTAPDLKGLAKVLSDLLQPHMYFIAIITHPRFWPKYWGYEKENWFCYDREIFIEAPFIISKQQTKIRTTHIHRPIEEYMKVFSEVGFHLEKIVEPIPPHDIQALYPKPWEFPRFLGLRWKKTR